MPDDAETAARLKAYVKLLRASRAVIGVVEPRIGAAGLTLTQFGVLEALLNKGKLTQRELIRLVLTSPGNMTTVIDKLSAAGLVSRVPCPEDRRSVHVVLTNAGRKRIATLFPLHAADIARAMAGLDRGEIAELDGLLRRLGRHAAESIPLAGTDAAS